MMRMMQCKRLKVNIAGFMAAILFAGAFAATPVTVYCAAPKTLTLKAARKMAILNSSAVESAEMAVESKKAAYESAVKSLKVKEQSLRQFRWSPLLKFKFPQSPNFAQASEFQYKPVQLSYDIKVAEHNLRDKSFEVSEKVNNLFVDIVALQTNIEFYEKRLDSAREGLKKNQAKLKLGQATQADVDKIEKNIESMTNKIATDKTTLSANLQKLSKMLGIDVTDGYNLEKPFVEANIDRTQLPAIIQYTEDRDEGYYEACIAETTARAELSTNSGLMKSAYGSDYYMISSYVQSALNGQSVNKKAFKSSYKSFLEKIDSYWQGKKRILFIKIPRIWFKGDLAGTRYIEDDPYTLYQNVLDYNAACTDKQSAKEDLDQQVIDTFNNYISVKKAYEQYIKDVDNAGKDLKKSGYLNRIGQLTFEEYQSELDSYEELQNSMLDAMKLYSTTLYSFDRLTCGGVNALLTGTDADLQTAAVGESYVEKEVAEGAYYTLRSIIQSQEFELSVRIPDDFEVSVSDYELWIDNIQVGSRTEVDKKLRHLMVTADGVDEVKIRLYDGDTFVDDCIIDPSEESGPLNITKGFVVKKEEDPEIGTFTIDSNEITGIVELKFEVKDENIRKFKILTDEGKAVGGDDQIEIEKPLKYISVITQSMDELKVEFYGEDGSLIVRGRLDDANGVVRREEE